MKTRILTLTLSIFLCVAARAELKWEQNTIELHPSAGDKTAVAHFKYQNTGTAPVHFKSVKASCGCTATQSQKEVVNPGEKGEIVATFTIGDRTGQQLKTVTVQTDDPNPTQTTTTLTLKANITPALEIKPPVVYWQNGEEPKPKKVSVKAAKEFPAKEITIKSNQNFESKVEPGKAGEWTIEVTPKDTSHPMGTALQIQTDYPKEAPKSFYLNVVVTTPPGLPPAVRPNVANTPASKPATPPAVPPASPAGGVER
jgi:uncharacterized cupredoxin-like copper-binding protein